MQKNRRFLLGAIAAGAVAPLLAGCGARREEIGQAVPYEPGKRLPWINWAGNQHCFPARRVAPASEAEVIDVLQQAKGAVRAVGASHAFSALVPTEGTLLATDLLSGLASHDPTSLQAELYVGTRLYDAGPLLASVGQAMSILPDVDHFSLGGAVATSVHGSGPRFGSLSSHVVGLTLATPRGELLECSLERNAEVFQAARVALGALGVLTRVRLQNENAYELTESTGIENTEDVLADIERRFAQHRHFEFLPLPNSNLAVTVATDPARPGDQSAGEDDPQAVKELRRLFEAIRWMPGARAIYDGALKLAMGDAASGVRTGPSYSVFAHRRAVRFREMEYIVPADAGPACLREILRTIGERRLPVCFPLEYRRVAADDIWLSMFQGRPGASIAVHQFADTDYRGYFAEIEPIFWKYDGRPHWGKIHTLEAKRLAALYPQHWKEFQEVRRTLDPESRMLNPFLKKIFEI